MFGENCDYIHSVVFCPTLAKPRYKHEEDFSERSIVQLRNKYKKDSEIIDHQFKTRRKEENFEWFEKKYLIDVVNYDNRNKLAKKCKLADSSDESSSVFSDSDEGR